MEDTKKTAREISQSIIDALDTAYSGRSGWGAKELAKAVFGHMNNGIYPRVEWFTPIQLLIEEADKDPHWGDFDPDCVFRTEYKRLLIKWWVRMVKGSMEAGMMWI